MIFDYFKKSLKEVSMVRFKIVVETIFMILNDFFFLAVWYIILRKNLINGWGTKEGFLFLAISMISYGVIHTFLNGISELGNIILRRELEKFLSKPGNILVHISFSSMQYSALGDLILGTILILLLKPSLLLLLAIPSSITIYYSFLLFSSALILNLSKYFDIRHLEEVLLTFAVWPSFMLPNILKVFLLVIIPSLAISFIPAKLLIEGNLQLASYLFLASLTYFSFSYFLFKLGLRNYERI